MDKHISEGIVSVKSCDSVKSCFGSVTLNIVLIVSITVTKLSLHLILFEKFVDHIIVGRT